MPIACYNFGKYTAKTVHSKGEPGENPDDGSYWFRWHSFDIPVGSGREWSNGSDPLAKRIGKEWPENLLLTRGEFGSVILEGQKVIPKKLLENGFVFQYPDIKKALQNIV